MDNREELFHVYMWAGPERTLTWQHIPNLENGFSTSNRSQKSSLSIRRASNKISVELLSRKSQRQKEWNGNIKTHSPSEPMTEIWTWNEDRSVKCHRYRHEDDLHIIDITSYVEIGRRGITGPSAVHGNTFVFPLVRLLAVLNLQSPCVED